MNKHKILALFIIIILFINIILPGITALMDLTVLTGKAFSATSSGAADVTSNVTSDITVDTASGIASNATDEATSSTMPATAPDSIPGAIYISSPEDLVSLATECSLDTWSHGKIVVLTQDIDVTGTEFTSIPTFGGTFDGGGYTISGLSLTGYGSPQGLFYYLQEGALVKKLTVEGVVTPVGAKSTLGGIVGSNNGTVQDCRFNGIIKGKRYVGGIAGINQAEGLITNCTATGIVYGEHYIGGIAGENLGILLLCDNEAKINTTVKESSLSLEDINIEKLTSLTSFSTSDVLDIADIGGIAGLSGGIIQSCINKGDVGYKSVGYNVGGIVGRQSGYIDGCVNEKEVIVCGRKDVGGIAGQIEPYTFWQLSGNSFTKLRAELNKLQGLINRVVNNADSYSSAITEQLGEALNYIEDARTSGDALVDQTVTMLNENIENINTVSTTITKVIVAMEPVMDLFASAIEDIKGAIGEFRIAMEWLEGTMDNAKIGMEKLEPAIDSIDIALGSIRAALDNISNALTSMKSGLGDPEAMKKAMGDLQKGMTSLINSMGELGDGARILHDAAVELENSQIWKDSAFLLKNAADELQDGVGRMSYAIDVINNAFSELEGDFDEEKLQAALISLESALANTTVATEKLYNGFSLISTAFEKIIKEYEDTGVIPSDWYDDLNEGFQVITGSMEDIQNTIKDLQDALNYLKEANIDPEKTEEDFETLKQGLIELVDSIKQMLDAMYDVSVVLDYLLKSEEIKTFGKEMKKGLEDTYDGMMQAIRSMERINSAMEKLSDQIDYEELGDSIEYIKETMQEMNNAIANIQDIKAYIEEATPFFEEASNKSSKAFSKAIDAIALMESASLDMSDAAKEIHNLISDLAEQPEISIKKVDSKFMETKDQFSDAFGGLFSSLSQLNSIISDASPVLLSDIRAISDQMFVVFDLLVSIIENVTVSNGELQDFKEDVSIQDTDGKGNVSNSKTGSPPRTTIDFKAELNKIGSESLGRVGNCINYGLIKGDINVGGITGAMAIEYEYDLEDDYNFIQKMAPDSKYLLRTIISYCENYGDITSKKNCVGGIVGLMDFGYVADSISQGNVASTGGDYVGGISGKSDGTIGRSYAKTLLSGTDYVGGIVGYGTNLYNCYSLIHIEEAKEFVGSIAGDGDGIWENNYFVHDDLAAINRISYSGKAEPITYERLLNVEELPSIFRTFQLRFIAEDEVVSIVTFNFGDSIPEGQIPVIPQREGHFGKWETDNFDNLKFDKNIKAIYEEYITALASEDIRDNGLSIILVNGFFDKDASLSTIELDREYREEDVRRSLFRNYLRSFFEILFEDVFKGIFKGSLDDLFGIRHPLEEWQISVTDDGQTTRMVHYLPPNQKTSGISIYVMKDGSWEKIKPTIRGKYLVFEMVGTNVSFFATYSDQQVVKIFLTAILGILAVILIFSFYKKWRNRTIPPPNIPMAETEN